MREDVKAAVLDVYNVIDAARKHQDQVGRNDQGNRRGMTSGHHLDGIADLIRHDLIDMGLKPDELYTHGSETVLPGWFRPTKSWDFLAFHKDELVAGGCGCFFGRLDGQSKALSVLHGTHPAQ